MCSLKYFDISQDLLLSIYAQIVSELAENGRVEEAIKFLRTSKNFEVLKESDQKKYRKLESFAFNFDTSYNYRCPEIYRGKSRSMRQCKRFEIADRLAGELQIIPESRMLTVVGQAMKYKRYIGELPMNIGQNVVKFNLFADKLFEKKKRGDGCGVPRRKLNKIKLGKKAYPSCVLFNKDYLISGSVDGLVEVFDPCTAKHALLDYQIKENFIFVGSAVLSMTHSRDHQLLALGTEGGDLSVYEIASGKLIRLFSKAHSGGISSIQFSPTDKSKILTCSLDKTTRIFGMNSGQLLKEYRGHDSYVNSAKFNRNAELIYTASSDGTIKVWKTSTSVCIKTIDKEILGSNSSSMPYQVAILDIIVLEGSIEGIIILNRTATITLMTADGSKVLKRYVARMSTDRNAKAFIFSSMVVSDSEQLLHGVANNFVYSFDIKGGELLGVLNTKDSIECLGICKSPLQDIYATYGKSGIIRFWESEI